MTLGIGKQHELPKRPGDWKSAKGEMNQVPEAAEHEAAAMKHKSEKPKEPPLPSTTDESK